MIIKTSNIKIIWAIKYVLPVIALFFTYGFLGQLYTLRLTKKDLLKNSGIVQSIDIVLEQSGRYGGNKYYPLIIKLEYNDFRLIDNFQDKYDLIKSLISVGDTISIYNRSSCMTYLGLGKKNDIYCIDKNGNEIFELKYMINYKRNQMIIFLIISLILWSSFFYFKDKIIIK